MLHMDEMTSSEFRRRYATLTQPISVTALGRLIGVWVPAADGTAITFAIDLQKADADVAGPLDARSYGATHKTVTITPGFDLNEGDSILALSPLRDDMPAGEYRAGPRFNSRPFAPAPKSGK